MKRFLYFGKILLNRLVGLSDVAIIGAGPAGLQTAISLKENGVESTIFEEHETIGIPTHCSGLISKSGVDELGLYLSDSLQNEIKGAKIFSPNKTMLAINTKKTVAYVVDRKKFDQTLLRKARLLNIYVSTGTKLIDVRKNTLFVQSEGRGEIRKAEVIVGADGVNSAVRHLLNMKVPKENYVHTMQATLLGKFDKEMVELHLGSFAKGFFGWVIPISEEKAKVGIGTTLGEDVSLRFKEFVKRILPESRIQNADSALIPCGPVLRKITSENIALVGDAAFHTKATTGGGIIFGMLAGNILGQSIANHLKNNARLSDYEKNLGKLNKELSLHWKIRGFLNSLTDKQIDELILKLKQRGIEEFLEREGDMDKPSRFIGKLAINPKYFFMVGTLLKFLSK